ncbi:MAG TPA: hypothetical protein VEQ85_03885 [Lacipirellulaceae bacterium]|nr:hypothetical protein [Lacipirellulaceae bacterium]
MNHPTTLEAHRVLPESAHREDAAQFVRWLLGQLQLPVECDGADAVLVLPPQDRDEFAGQQRLRLPMRGAAAAGQESLAWDGRFGRWLLQRTQQAGSALHARPRVQPMAVSEIAARLFPAYQVDGGQMHLAGCQLTDHPFVRLSFAGDEPDGDIRHVYVAPDGSTVGDQLVPQLGLDDLTPLVKGAPRLDPTRQAALVAAGRRIAVKQSTSRHPDAVAVEPIAVAVIWVRHAEGRVQFAIGAAAAALAFSSWARLLEAPPFQARHSGAQTFHLAATDDGRIDAAEQIEACQQSGRRVLKGELVPCSVTGKRVLADFTAKCPVSGRPALRHEFATCMTCRQRVSKVVMVEGRCGACRTLTRVGKDEPRLAWILGEHAGLDAWNRWRLAETADVYIAEAAGMLKRLLLVVDKETLAVRRLATATRLNSDWAEAPEAERPNYLG